MTTEEKTAGIFWIFKIGEHLAGKNAPVMMAEPGTGFLNAADGICRGVRRLCSEDEIMAPAKYSADDETIFTTGTIGPIDGGWTL